MKINQCQTDNLILIPEKVFDMCLLSAPYCSRKEISYFAEIAYRNSDPNLNI